MNMIWHLIRKDHRVLGKWLALWAGFQVLATVLCYVIWRRGGTDFVNAFLWPLFIYGSCVLTLIIHQEPLVRGVDFWRTRPLRPKHLLLGKGFTIGLHFVLIPSLICLAFLLATGYGSYLGVAGVEWLWKLASWLIPVMAIAVFSNSFPRFLGIALGVVVGFGLLLTIHEVIRKELVGHEVKVWLPFPSKTIVVTAGVLVFGIGLTLRQYLVGGLRGAIKWLVLGALVIQGVWWLPLHRDRFSAKLALPSSNAVLDELLDDRDLIVGPLACEHEPHSEREGVEFLWVEREPSYIVGSRVHDLQISVDEGASRLETAQGPIVSPNPQPIVWRRAERADYLATVAATWPAPRDRGEFGRILEVPRQVVDQLGGSTGTLHAEAVAMLRESEVIARLPLREGATSRKGPHMINIRSVKPRIDGNHKVQVVYSVYFPSRVVTEPWHEVTSNGLESTWLVHKRLNVALGGDGGSSRSSGRLHPLMRHHRFSYDFRVPSQVETLSTILWKEEFRAEDWELVVLGKRITASKRLPFTVPGFCLSREVPRSPVDVLTNIYAVPLPGNGSDAEVEDYLWGLWKCWGNRERIVGETIEKKIVALGVERLPVILRVHERLVGSHWQGARSYGLRAIKELVTDADQELILEHLDTIPKLLEVIEARGWEEAAIPRMIEIAQAMPRVPYAWIEFFVQMGERHPEVILGMHDYSEFDEKYFEPLREVPGFPLEELVDRILLTSIHKFHHAPPDGLLSAVTLGRPNALDFTRLYLKGDGGTRSVDEDTHADPLLERLSELTSCPATREGALVWLEQHARTATFNQATGRYQISK